MIGLTRCFIISILAVMLLATLAKSEDCRIERYIVTEDFAILCSQSWDLMVEITCKTSQPWSRFPRDQLNLERVNVTIRSCNLPQGLSLLNITRSLNISHVEMIRFEDFSSAIKREHLYGLDVMILDIFNSTFYDFPEDLLYDINPLMLFIANGTLDNIPNGLFKNSVNLTHLEFSQNKLLKLKRGILDDLVNLQLLLLFGNRIDEIEQGAFDKLVNLRILDISKNQLKTLHPDIFKNLVSLERINIGENEFTHLPADLFHFKNNRLQSVRFSHNRGGMTNLPENLFQELSSLAYAELTSNNFTNLPSDLFAHTHSLKALNISANNLVSLPAGLLRNTRDLWEFQASYNELELIPEKLFENANLVRLYLNFNRITNLTSGIVTGLDNLKILDVSHNNLSYIDHYACYHLKSLKHVDLSYNELTYMNVDNQPITVLADCMHIVDLDLSYNKLTEMFYDYGVDAILMNLNLENNLITSISAYDFVQLRPGAKVNLRYNKITTFDLSKLEDMATEYINANGNEGRKAKVYLDGNPLNCDCNLLHFIRFFEKKLIDSVYNYLRISSDGLRCATPSHLQNLRVTEVRSKELKCKLMTSDIVDACNDTCTCWEYPGKAVQTVDCSYKNLTNLPSQINSAHNWSIELNMTGNKLNVTPALKNMNLRNVTVLDLSSNNISTVSLDVFSPNLRDLKLHNNRISRLNSKIVEYLKNDDTLESLTLYENRWICDCEARNILGLVQRKPLAFQLHEVMCYDTNRRLSSMTVDELCASRVTIIICASLLTALFGLVLGCLAALYYRYQKEIKVWLYSKQCCLWFVTEDELDSDKKYDAFISFSHKDEDFVDKEIVSKLEEGPRPYKLCLHYRDWLAGEWIPAQIARSVDESRRTIVILSPNFLMSVWGRMEFRTAHSQALSEGRARVIVILYDDIGNTEDLDPELKAYLSMNTYVKWGDPWFWDKLRYALPHRHEASRSRSRNACIIANHLAQLSMNNHNGVVKPEVISMPKVSISADHDSATLSRSDAENERIVVNR